MKQQRQIHSDKALADHPDDRHPPEPVVRDDKLGDSRGKGRPDLKPGGFTDAEQMLEQQNLKRTD